MRTLIPSPLRSLLRLCPALAALLLHGGLAHAAPEPVVNAQPAANTTTATAATSHGPGAPRPRPRVALVDLEVQTDDPSQALSMQLQDGFVLALVTNGIDVLDPIDVAGRIADEPALKKCDSSPCLKRIGQRLGVHRILRVRIEATGNNYRLTARLFGTEGPAPGALPSAVKTRLCDVCTVNEARDKMIRLADDVRPLLEEEAVAPPPPPLPPPPPSFVAPIAALAAGALAITTGAIVVGQASGESKRAPALGGALAGAGAACLGVGLYVTFERWQLRTVTATQPNAAELGSTTAPPR